MLEAARRRVERLEQPVLDRDVRAGERVQQRRLADVRVAGERDRRRLACGALLAARRALPLELLQAPLEHARCAGARAGGRSRAATRPGRACRRRRRGARGAATCPACAAGCTRAARARPGACPRRSPRAGRRCRGSAACGRRPASPSAFSRKPLLRRVELVVDEQALGARLAVRAPSAPRACPCRRTSAASGRARCWTSSPTGSTPAVRAQLADLGELVVRRRPRGQHGEDEARAPAPGAANVESSGRLCPRCGPGRHASPRARSRSSTSPRCRRAEAAPSRSYVARRVPPEPVLLDDGESLLYATRAAAGRSSLLAGHTDTVPAQGEPARRDRRRRRPRPRRQRHEGRPRRDDRARALGRVGRARRTTSASSSSRARSSAPAENPLPGVFERGAARRRSRPRRLLEPTDNTLQLGCLGNLTARVVFEGRAGHSARPWLGVNAIGVAVEGLAASSRLEPRDVELEGLLFREVLSVTRDPRRDRVERHPGARRGDAQLPLRARPDARRGRARACASSSGRRRRDPRELPAPPTCRRSTRRSCGAARRRRLRGRAEAGVDERRRLLRARARRRQPRAGRDAVRAHRGRAGRDRGARTHLRRAAAVPRSRRGTLGT